MSATTDIGSKIKKYRKEKKYTLKNLSEQTGLSIGFLSQLERGITTIAIDSLANVADVLGVEMMDFFESDLHQENDPVMRSYDLPTRLLSVEQIEYCLGKESFALRPKILQLMPCAQKEEKPEAVKAESERFLFRGCAVAGNGRAQLCALPRGQYAAGKGESLCNVQSHHKADTSAAGRNAV